MKAGLLTAIFMVAFLLIRFPALSQSVQQEQAIKLGTELVVLDAEVINRKTGQATVWPGVFGFLRSARFADRVIDSFWGNEFTRRKKSKKTIA
jgi:hypothetical protein